MMSLFLCNTEGFPCSPQAGQSCFFCSLLSAWVWALGSSIHLSECWPRPPVLSNSEGLKIKLSPTQVLCLKATQTTSE